MKKHYILISAFAAIAFASCSSDDFLGQLPTADDGQTAPIAFFSNANHMSRAASHAESAALLHNNFVVFGESFSGTATTPIFDNYNVYYEAGSAHSTTSNSSDWEYAGLTSRKGAGQDVKYWNFSTDKYQFVAASGIAPTELFANSTDGIRINVPSADAMTNMYVSDRVTATPVSDGTSTAYKDVVTLQFRRLGAQMRIGFYETIPGYAVKDLIFYYVGAPSGSYNVGVGGAFPKSGKYTITYDAQNSAHAAFAATANMSYSNSFGPIQYTGAESKFADASKKYIDADGQPVAAPVNVFIGSSAAETTFGKGTYTIDGKPSTVSEYRPILPNENNTLKMQMRVDYTLVALDGSGEQIHVRDAYVSVPLEYCKWKPNTSYTYIFKISDASNGYTGEGGGGTITDGPGRDPEPGTGGDNDPVVDPSTGEVIPPYVPDPNYPDIPNPDYDPDAPPTIPNPDAQPEIPNPGYDPTQPTDPTTNPETIPNPGYDPTAPDEIPNPDAAPTIPDPDAPLIPNPDYPTGPGGDQHDPSNPVPTPQVPNPDYDPTDPDNPDNPEFIPDPENPATLFPITFDAVVIDSEEFQQETITTVATPAITTHAAGSDVVNRNEYKVGEVIELTATADDLASFAINGWSYAVSTEAITEKRAETIASTLTFTDLTDNKLTPAAKGYYIVRLTYNTDKAAYKVIKVVE